ncbi:MAG: DUF3048 domain-containing protein [Defluviitaleaceae bacterium]|nr:DUF3048 domain-containing protein [Defluviitaleaceae bacterium]
MPSKKTKDSKSQTPPYVPKRQNPDQLRSTHRKKLFLTWLLIFSAAGLFIVPVSLAIVHSMSRAPAPVYTTTFVPVPIPTPTPTPIQQPLTRFSFEPWVNPMEGMVFSQLTGLPIPEEVDFLRPIAVVVNNHSRALPQSGIIDAEVIYEVLAEGNITRLVVIHQQLESPMIGPVRSTRQYFADFAMEKDAIFAHHGGSPSGYARLRQYRIDALDGMNLEGTTFWRDPERFRIPMLIEHSSYTSAERIEAAVETRNIRRERYADDGIGFSFNRSRDTFEEIAQASGGDFSPCWELIVPFSTAYPRTFVYDPETMTYVVYNVYGPHVDRNVLEDPDVEDESLAQVRATNILVQLTSTWIVPGDAEGRREVTTVGSGYGYLATQGGIVNVRWTRDSIETPTRWYFMNGDPLLLTPGQTWICIISENATIEIITEEPEREDPPLLRESRGTDETDE